MDESFRPDARKTLPVLNAAWEECTACNLGNYRKTVGGAFVAGEGQPGGIMFIGEGPGKEEETAGRPFVGQPGRILRSAIELLGITRYYITNTVPCRSCMQDYDGEGQPKYRKDFKTGVQMPVIFDLPPSTAQMSACRQRLQEEIYIIDPALIVSLGPSAAAALSGRAVSIQSENGVAFSVSIPGAGRRASLTDKKQAWVRKVRGEFLVPNEQSTVEYLIVPVLHPQFVSRKRRDERWQNPVQMFVEGMRKASSTYNRYMFEVYGFQQVHRDLTTDDLQRAMDNE